jgi:RHS repeat-associated protein
MMTTQRLAPFVLAIVVSVAALEAATPSKFRPAGADPEIGRYIITVGDASVDIAAMKQEVAAFYGATPDSDAPAGVGQFAVTMTPARARLLSADPRIVEVTETAPAPPSAASARHFAPRALGYGDTGESGTYTYDSSGNITAIGADTYLYDAQGRLKESVTRGVTETYTYDAFGNRKSAIGATNCLGQTTCATTVTVDSATNRLTNSGVSYDAAGNMTAANGGVYTYDGTGMMIQATVGSDDRQFVYTADDERIAVRQGVSWTWTVRDPGAKVLREFTSMENTPGVISSMTNRQWLKDYVWRDGLLLATTTSTSTLHYHLDHLGTPRLITDANHVKVAEHAYYPFGAEIALTPHESIEEAMKFTGHERDIVAGDGHTLDDMHARYYNPSFGRFLEVDPVEGDDPRNPQSWNRYSYVENRPIGSIDPAGMAAADFIFPSGGGNDAFLFEFHPGDDHYFVDADSDGGGGPPARTTPQAKTNSGNHTPTITSADGRDASGFIRFFVKFDGPSISTPKSGPGTGRLIQVRVGTDPNKPVMFRLDFGPLEKGGDPKLHINIQQQGKGQRGFNYHINIDPRNFLRFTSRPFLAFPKPVVPILNPCMFMNCGTATGST